MADEEDRNGESEPAEGAAPAPPEAADAGGDDAPPEADGDAPPLVDDDTLLDRWVEAKRAKDFATADRLREELRSRGVEPDNARPAFNKSLPPTTAPPAYDEATEAKLAQWVSAKRAKDFAQADALREELRAQGVDPDKARPAHPASAPPQQHGYYAPPPYHGAQGYGTQYDRHIEAKLSDWVQAKRDKDFSTADRIREELRAGGVDPEQARPPHHPAFRAPMGSAGSMPREPASYQSHGSFAPALEAQLDEWVQAKRRKDYSSADRLREELRAQGVDPDKVRPASGARHQPPPPAYGGGGGGGGGYGHHAPPYGHHAPPPYYDPYSQQAHDWHQYYHQPPPSYQHPPAYPPRYDAPPARHDARTEAQLEEWVQAKRRKDYAVADRIREELRSRGVDAEAMRPAAAGSKRPRQEGGY
jgi:cysteinyl-tRNA synthetase